MMDVHGYYEMRRQKYQDMLREAEQYRLARELGVTDADRFRSIAARFWNWLPRILSLKVTRSNNTRSEKHLPIFYGKSQRQHPQDIRK